MNVSHNEIAFFLYGRIKFDFQRFSDHPGLQWYCLEIKGEKKKKEEKIVLGESLGQFRSMGKRHLG